MDQENIKNKEENKSQEDMEKSIQLKDDVINDLKENLENQRQKYEEQKIDKKALDTKFMKSNIVQRQVSQVQGQTKYSNELYRRLEESYANILDIEKMRGFEIKDQQDRDRQTKEKLIFELAVVKRDLQMYKEREDASMEIEKLANVMRDDEEVARHNKIIEDLNKNILSQTEKLKETLKLFDEEKHRCSKWQMEVMKVKENYYDQLQQKYSNTTDVVMRHKRYQDMFLNLYNLNTEHNLGIKEVLDEIKKYVNSRDEKINFLEKKLKRSEKEQESEKNRVYDYLAEIQSTAMSFGEIHNQYEIKTNEIKNCNDNFNKLFKEKHSEKLSFVQEKNSLQARIKTDTENSHLNSCQQIEYKKEIDQLNTHIKEMEGTMWAQKKILEELNEEKTDHLKKIEESQIQIDTYESKQKVLEESNKDMVKEFSHLRKDASEKSQMLSQFIKSAKKGEELDIKNMSSDQILYERMELKRMRKMLSCPVCEKREKEVIVMKCMHTFCNECIQKNLEHRERKCPLCMVKISQADVKKIFLE